MTASPNRPRSQNAASAPNSDPAKPVRETAAAGSTPMRALPPTLFKLRNLNAAAPAVVIPPKVQAAVVSEPSPAALPVHDSSAVTSQAVTCQRQGVGSSNAAVDLPPRRSFVSRLSNQSLVLFVILAIAITGIVVGNRGSDVDQTVADVPQTTEDLKLAGSQNAGSEAAVSSVDPLLTSSSETHVAATTGHTHSYQGQRGTPASDAAKHNHEDAVTAEAMNRYGDMASSIPQQSDQILSGQAIRSTAPNGLAISAATADATQFRTTHAPIDQTTVRNPVTATDSAMQGAFANASTDMGTHDASHPIKTRTPLGVDDWSRYLPNAGPNPSNTGTVAATSATPQSPISSYQQYLDSLTPNLPQTTAPVGYLADPADVYGANTVGTQAQLPTSTSPSQRR